MAPFDAVETVETVAYGYSIDMSIWYNDLRSSRFVVVVAIRGYIELYIIILKKHSFTNLITHLHFMYIY